MAREEERLARINELSRKSRTPEGLTPEEQAEQKALREEYLAAFRKNLEGELSRTYVLEPDGTKRPLRRREDKK